MQLVDVTVGDNGYAFGFERLQRWIDTAERAGMKYFEISHLFTQWGAVNAPKIMATRDGEYVRVFGWETDARGEEYKAFLRAFLTALTGWLKERGLYERCRFHVSDEPNPTSIDNYTDAAAVIKQIVDEDKIIDALSNAEYYDRGIIRHPIPASDMIEPFLQRDIPQLWTYYCCGQYRDVSNRFIAMPAQRTRVIGVQMYKYDIAGFLQWGYNFWNSHLSYHPINPYATTDADGTFPAGDAFTVYPGEDGPLSSMRQYLFYEALCDIRALRLLESDIGRDAVMALIEPDGQPVTFSQYPRDRDYLPALRQKVNKLLARKTQSKH